MSEKDAGYPDFALGQSRRQPAIQWSAKSEWAHFRDYHLLFDEHADQLFAMTDVIAKRVRKIGETTLKSIGQISRTQRVLDNDAAYVEPEEELMEDNKILTARLREAHNVCEEGWDVATTSLIEVWIDETERRTWFLFDARRPPTPSRCAT